MKVITGTYQLLELFLEICPNFVQPQVILKKQGWKKVKSLSCYHQKICFHIDMDCEYELELKGCMLCLGYLSECSDIMERGVCFVEDDRIIDKKNLAVWYDTPDRAQYHFSIFKNWMNDPNGLCWYNGYYHLFYQANPYSQQWDNMYWGHAVSKDLVYWTHLPIVFEPQQQLMMEKTHKGGAFSGSTLICGDIMEIYLTRHFSDCIHTEECLEYQVVTRSRDGLYFDPEKTVIMRPSGMFSYNFRDPKVFVYKGRKMLVLGSMNHNVPAILLYEERDGQWQFLKSLLEEHETKGITTFECPDFFELDDCFVAVAAYMDYVDSNGRRQGVYYYTGDFNGDQFDIKFKGLYDFCANFYAVQSFEHQGRRIAVGWISDPWNEYEKRKNGANGSMSLPRELHVRNGHLYQKPIREIECLYKDKIYEGNDCLVEVNIPGNAWHASVSLESGTEFELLLAKDGNKEIRLYGSGSRTFLRTPGTKTEKVNFEAVTQPVNYIEIFMDRKVCEIFINDGEAVGTKIFYMRHTKGIFKAKVKEPRWISVCSVDGIW